MNESEDTSDNESYWWSITAKNLCKELVFDEKKAFGRKEFINFSQDIIYLTKYKLCF